jgi:hypothetical protein
MQMPVGEKAAGRRGARGASEWDVVSATAAGGLEALLDEKHGNPVDTAQAVLKGLIPAVLMSYAGTTHTPIPAPLVATSERAARLIARVAAMSGPLSDSAGIALQHICVGAAAARKAEYRAQACSAIVLIVPALVGPSR